MVPNGFQYGHHFLKEKLLQRKGFVIHKMICPLLGDDDFLEEKKNLLRVPFNFLNNLQSAWSRLWARSYFLTTIQPGPDQHPDNLC